MTSKILFRAVTFLSLAAAASGLPRPASAAVTIRARVFDGVASARALQGAVRDRQALDAQVKVSLPNAAISLVLLPMEGDGGSDPTKTWNATADAEGKIVLETGLESVPEGQAFVASATLEGRKVFSPFFLPQSGADESAGDSIHLYPTTESPLSVRAQLKVAYDLQKEGGDHLIRVRAGLQLNNIGEAMYIGSVRGSRWREVWRIPVPVDAKILLNRGPLAGGPRWRRSSDLRWLLIDAPVPGLCDVNLQGTWEVQYTLPARQHLIQKFPVPGHLESLQLSLWAVDGDTELSSAQLRGPVVDQLPDPFTSEQRRFRVLFVNESSHGSANYVAAVSVDNAAIGQVSEGAALWVGSFVLVVLAAVAVGLGLGRRRASPAEAMRALEGEDVLDRIAALDARFARGGLAEKDYRLYREALVQIAAKDLDRAGANARAAEAPLALPAGAREILQRLDGIDASGIPSPAAIAERAHLLEALAKVLPRRKEDP